MIMAKLDDDSYLFHLEAIFEMMLSELTDNSSTGHAMFTETERGMNLTILKGRETVYDSTIDFKSKRRAIECFILHCSKLLLK